MRRRETLLRWREANKEKHKRYNKAKNLKANYNASLEWFEAKQKEQSNLCAICKQPETAKIRNVVKDLSVDHDHRTKSLRGLLCSDCNRALGMFKEDILILTSAIEYLKFHASSK